MSKNVLIIDIGNTATELAVFNDGNLQEFLGFFKLPSEIDDLKKELIKNSERGLKVDDGMIFSVVPCINEKVGNVVKEVFGVSLKVFDWQHYELKNKNTSTKEAIGADLLADIIGARKESLFPCLIADFGTITKLLYLDEKSSFEGLSLLPGLETTIKSYSFNTALLPELKKSQLPKNRLGLNTAESMFHGVYYSTVYYVNETLKSLGNSKIKLVVTGGNLRYLKDAFEGAHIDPELTLKGMYELYTEVEK